MLGKSHDRENWNCPVVSYRDCPAKTYQDKEGVVHQGRSVLNHCNIVGEVAREIIERFPLGLGSVLFPEGAFMAAAGHDIGKVSPYFFEKLRRACESENCDLEPLTEINPNLEREWGGHAGVSQVTAKALNAPSMIPEILGQHHGFSPPVEGKRATDQIFGGPLWQMEREALVTELMALLGTGWPTVESVSQARLLAGLTSVADWIGSGEFFESPATPWQEKVAPALDHAGFIPPGVQPGMTFQQVFGFEPYPIQQRLIEQVTGPGVYVMEAPMGIGKTEAALFAAYRMLESGQSRGVYFALPTRLTSNKIFERFNLFLESVLAKDCQHRSLLLHSSAWLQATEIGEEGRPGGAWFNQSKRGLLAPFAVGTMDQALMAVMNVKHGFVRAFGLAGKVVILDEVHTYDAYTGTLLDALIELLCALHCTVIILTATLSHGRRQQLLGCKPSSDAYPLITAVPRSQSLVEVPVSLLGSQRIVVRMLDQDKPAIEEAIKRAMQGQQVLWIENSVREAQDRYLDMAARSSEVGLACGLLHSRFIADDRQELESNWVNLFGKHGWPERQKQGRILVGTQVLEQSLDIDADFMVSRFAPSDMLLQRVGRLWRHANTPRAKSSTCEIWLLAPQIEQARIAPKTAFGPTAFVYSPYVLCRSLEVWQERTSLNLPNDIRALIEQTYAQRSEDREMAVLLHELDHGVRGRIGRKALRQLARVGLAESGKTLPERKAQTRYSETDTYDVLLLRGLESVPEQMASQLTLLSGRTLLLPWRRHKLSKPGWRELSATLMKQVVSLRVQDAPRELPLETLKKFGFQHCFYLGNPEFDEALLRVAIVDENGLLQGIQGERVHDRHSLIYRSDLGYQVIKG